MTPCRSAGRRRGSMTRQRSQPARCRARTEVAGARAARAARRPRPVEPAGLVPLELARRPAVRRPRLPDQRRAPGSTPTPSHLAVEAQDHRARRAPRRSARRAARRRPTGRVEKQAKPRPYSHVAGAVGRLLARRHRRGRGGGAGHDAAAPPSWRRRRGPRRRSAGSPPRCPPARARPAAAVPTARTSPAPGRPTAESRSTPSSSRNFT